MGRAHSNAYNQIPIFFPETQLVPVKQVVCGTAKKPLEDFALQFGWNQIELDWIKLLKRDDLDIFDNCAPNYLHKDPVIMAAELGKHILCEKPLALTLDEAREIVSAVEKADVKNMIGFNYRRVPAIWLAKKLIENNMIGRIYHFRGQYLQDWIVNPDFPLVWRLNKDLAGSGAHGDLNSHIIDLAHFLVGKISKVIGMEETFIKKRYIDSKTGENDKMGEVTVDDTTSFLAKFENGAVGTFEATRFATGMKNYFSFEINGSKGSLKFNLERLNELNFLDATSGEPGFNNILVTESNHSYMSNWWPPGHIIGWEHTHIFQIKDFLDAIESNGKIHPDFRDGAYTQAVLEAVSNSILSGKWESINKI